MSERYTRIFEGESDLYMEGSPVMISAAVLLNDTETGRVIAQMKFRSLSEKRITYLKVRVKPFDMLKNALSPVEFEYTDLSADMYDQFGQKTPAVLPDTSARSYEAAVIGAAFSDGTVWKSSETEWHPDPEREKEAVKAVTYNNAVNVFSKAKEADGYKKAAELFKKAYGFKDADALAEQCLEKYEACRKDAVYTFAVTKMTEHTVNGYEAAIRNFRKIPGWKDADKQIIDCHQKIEEIKAKEEADRLEAARKAEERRIAVEKAAKKRKKIIAITTPIIVACIAFVIVLTTVIIPKQKLNKAMGLLDSGDYEAAYMLLNGLNYKDSADKAAECLFLKQKSGLTNVKAGSTIEFGLYEQDNNTSNGKEEIEWEVLTVEGNKALVISKYALDCQKYNSTYTDTTWEKCTLRIWLNVTFYDAAFGTDHQKMIVSSTVTADKNPSYNTSPGNNTTDKVFLLSITEANKYFKSDEARKCAPTDYAIAQGAWTSDSYKTGGRATCWWWLRSPGNFSDIAAYVNYDGSVSRNGRSVRSVSGAVRPALWISLGD